MAITEQPRDLRLHNEHGECVFWLEDPLDGYTFVGLIRTGEGHRTMWKDMTRQEQEHGWMTFAVWRQSQQRY